MSEIEKVKEPQKLFRYSISKHIQRDGKQKLHFYRVNRWRFNTFNRFNLLKFLRLKGPLIAAWYAIFAYDYTFGFFQNAAQH